MSRYYQMGSRLRLMAHNRELSRPADLRESPNHSLDGMQQFQTALKGSAPAN